MSKRQRRDHETVHEEQAARAWMRRLPVLAMGLVAGLLVVAGIAVMLIQSPWFVQHRGQVIGALGLALFVVLLLVPVVAEVSAHPRHLSGPGKNPEQGPGPWDIGGR